MQPIATPQWQTVSIDILISYLLHSIVFNNQMSSFDNILLWQCITNHWKDNTTIFSSTEIQQPDDDKQHWYGNNNYAMMIMK